MPMDSLHKQKNVALDALMPMIRQDLTEGRSVRFGPKGTSMLPMLRQGIDSVTISPTPETLRKYDLPLYQRDNGGYVLHRIVGVGETYTCIGDNQFEKEYGVRRDQIIGVVTEFSRDQRTVSVKNPWYQLYCRVWAITRFPRRCWRKLRSLLK